MSFTVDPDSLRQFRSLLMHIGWDITTTSGFIIKNSDLSLHEEGLLNRLFFGHEKIVESMQDRLDLMREITYSSAGEIEGAAQLYEEIDESNAVELDAEYPDPVTYHPDGGHDKEASPEEADFKQNGDVEDKLKIDIPSDTEMMGSEIEKWARDWLPAAGTISGVRAVFAHVFEFDPIDWVRKWWFGEWTAWAKAAAMWEGCAGAVDMLELDLRDGVTALEQVWEGKAALDASHYFQNFAAAIAIETEAFTALRRIYEVIMEMIYEIHLVMNDVINATLDIVFTILTLGGSQGVKAALKAAFGGSGNLVQRLVSSVSSIGTILSIVIDVVKIVETVNQATDLQEVPPSELKELCKNDSGKLQYEHRHPKDD